MGVNAGAFFGITLCGYIGEKISWPFGFGLAGGFMLMGVLQFYLGQSIFGRIGLDRPAKKVVVADKNEDVHVVRDRLKVILIFSFFTIFFWFAYEQAGGSMTIFASAYTDRVLDGYHGFTFKIVNGLMTVIPTLILSVVMAKLFFNTANRYLFSNLILLTCISLIWGIVLWIFMREFALDQANIPASWFGGLTSFFIVILAPLFSKLWEKYWNPGGAVKFGLGLVFLGLGFVVLAYGALGVPSGAKTASVSIMFLVCAYLLHTMGELCVSPVGLSYISKLAPPRLLGVMFGVWFVNTAIANKLAGSLGSYIDHISTVYSLTTFFSIFAVIPILAGTVMIFMNRFILRKMHGVV